MLIEKKLLTGKELFSAFENAKINKMSEQSLARYTEDIYDGKIEAYLNAYLKQILEACNSDIAKIPKVYDLNICENIINKQASLYANPVKRLFINVNDEQSYYLTDLYSKWKVSNIALDLNRRVRLLGGALVLVDLFDGEIATISRADYIDLDLQVVFEFKGVRFVYDKESGDVFHFDKKRNLVKVDGEFKVFEVATHKKKIDSSLASFTVSLNASMTDIKNTVHHQAFAQPYVRGSENVDSLMERIDTGPTRPIVLKESIGGVKEEFGYITPNANITGAIEYIRTESSVFAQTRGLTSSEIMGGDAKRAYSSALERLLAMIDDNKTAVEDSDYMRLFEIEIFESFKSVLGISDDASIAIEYYHPEMVKTKSEIVAENLELERIGAQDRTQTIANINGISRDEVNIYDNQVQN